MDPNRERARKKESVNPFVNPRICLHDLQANPRTLPADSNSFGNDFEDGEGK